MFIPSQKDVFSWKVPDPEFGEIMNGHLFIRPEGYLIMDPPMMPELLDKLRTFGKCLAVVTLSPSHLRGSGFASSILQAPSYVPEFATAALNSNSPNVVSYKEGDELPGGLKAVEIQTGIGIFGEHKVREMALLDNEGRVFIGDICHGYEKGQLALAPEDIFPGYTEMQVKSSLKAILEKVPVDIKTGFFGHGDDLVGTFGQELQKRKNELGV